MKFEDKVQEWIENTPCETMRNTLQKWLDENDEKAAEDAFFQDLEFGTAGLRGTIGPGTNKMNATTVARATQGLANYLNKNYEKPRVAIAHDSRNKGERFTEITASVLAANGITAHVFPRLEATPALAFATQHLNCNAGICITASHNPKEYNGYKVFNNLACQITSQVAKDISSEIQALGYFEGIKQANFEEAVVSGLIKWIDDECMGAFVSEAIAGVPNVDKNELQNLKVVYTPLNGTGREPVLSMFDKMGIKNVHIVAEQEKPDGNFPTCPSPNPEEKEALELGIKLSKEVNADVLLATDPDADRTGIAVNHNGDVVLVTGNEVGLLLMDHLAKQISSAELPNKVFCTTLVSTSMADAIAKEYGFELRRVPTGFKYIGEQITLLESQGRRNDFVMGFEESYGYLIGTHVRDKDSISATLAICDMVAKNKAEGKDLIDVLEELYAKFGYYKNSTQSFQFPGADGADKMNKIMLDLKNNPPTEIAGRTVVSHIDYSQPTEMQILNSSDGKTQLLPEINVVQFDLEGEAKLIIRPSGTEPKIKAYSFVRGTSPEDATQQLATLKEAASKLLA